LPGLHRLLFNKYSVDELYDRVFVRGVALGGGETLYTVDRLFWDGGEGEVRPGLGVNGIAWAVRDLLARASGVFDRGAVDGTVNAVGAILDNLSYVFRAVQNGLVQYYALCMVIGFFLMLALAGLRWVL
jgi:NADH:ubiquinone oxidoreductase subunit 5 (subunit L)/multisubunit Na+/H+ antiporter MnhA subunit